MPNSNSAVKNPLRKSLRNILKIVARSTPFFRGKGRIINALDGLLTNYNDPESYLIETVINDTTPFILDLRPWGQRFAYYYGGWERQHIRMNRALYRIAGGNFLDIGSSLGLYTSGLSKEVMDEKKLIYSFEPIAFNAVRQKRNIGLVKYLKSHVCDFDVALGSEPGFISLIADSTEADNNAFIKEGAEHDVVIKRLDDVVAENSVSQIGLIKIDVEGWEPEILKGARLTIRHHTPIVFAEFNRQGMARYGFSMDESWGFLVKELGYIAYIRHGALLVRILEYAEHEDIYFIPKRLAKAVFANGLIG